MKSFLWRHKSLMAIWLVVFGIGSYAGYVLFLKSNNTENPYVLSDNASQPADESVLSEAEPGDPVQATVGEAIADGGLEFTVYGIKCGESTIGSNAYAHDVAEGEFCRLSLEIKNTGTEQASVPVSRLKAIADGGKEYGVDAAATQFTQADLSNGDWHAQIPPSTTRIGDFAFDVAAGATISKVLLYGGENTAGIEISL